MSSTESKPTRFEPAMSEVTEPFWEATRNREFLLQWCSPCDKPIFYPREVCPQCLSSDGLEWRPASGEGTIYAASVQHKPGNPLMADRVPYVVALVELAEGPRLMTNVINCEPEAAAIGAAVRLTWEALSDGRHLPQFELSHPENPNNNNEES